MRSRLLRLAPLGFALALLVGVALRLTWASDMEYKGDERYMFDRSQHVGRDEPWPELGMESGVGTRNPGMSIWVFAVIARIFAATTPLGLGRAVMLLNCAALVALFAFAWLAVPKEERDAWLWGGALAAVNPIAVYLERKIWAQSVLPLFCVAFLVGFWRRDRWWGAILWGFVGALLGQIHMSGFFFAAGFFVWDAALGRGTPDRPRAKWIGWLVGSCAGAVSLVPWIRYVLTAHEKGPPYDWDRVFSLRFYRLWFSDTLGLGLDSSLGPQFLDFLRYPLHAKTQDLYPALYMHGVAFAVGAALVIAGAWKLFATRGDWVQGARTPLSVLRALRTCSNTTFTVCAALLGYGLLITISSVFVWRHYLIITFPLEWVACALLALKVLERPRRALIPLAAATLAITMTFLDYIHTNHGAMRGDYGPTFASQYPRGYR